MPSESTRKGSSWTRCLFGVSLLLAGCDGAISSLQPEPGANGMGNPNGIPVSTPNTVAGPVGRSAQPIVSASVPQRTAQTILVASFNIKVFGESKAKKQDVMEKLASVIRLFDIVAIQEIKSKDDRVMPTLQDYVNAAGCKYQFMIGPRLGRTSSLEQYAFIYDTTRIAPTAEPFTVQDGRPAGKTEQQVGESRLPDLLHREPMVGKFQTLAPRPFTFTLANIHTDPDEVKVEVDVLYDVYSSIRRYEYANFNEDDVLLLGDLNASPRQFGRLGGTPNLRTAITTQSTMVQGNNTNDNILMDGTQTLEFTGRSGVLSLAEAFRLSVPQALELSDHNPVWAEFTASEAQGLPQMATASTLERK